MKVYLVINDEVADTFKFYIFYLCNCVDDTCKCTFEKIRDTDIKRKRSLWNIKRFLHIVEE